MIKVIYHSDYIEKEIKPGEKFNTIPLCAYLEIISSENNEIQRIYFNDKEIDISERFIHLYSDCTLTIISEGLQLVYCIEMLVDCLKDEYADSYSKFLYDYKHMLSNELESIRNGSIKLYAVEQSTDVHDCSELLDYIEKAYSNFRAICQTPKSHLKAVNEVRPIETVKRIGYESIPYLASHSEDWLARTASGLKPARLFSRVENDEFQIYENRVVKTLIDKIISYLIRKEKEVEKQFNQLDEIMNNGVHTDSFGFDKQFSMAINELLSTDDKNYEYRSESWDLAKELLERLHTLLKKYRSLKQLRLYKYLRRVKPVTNPLNETNILLLDKNYSVIFALWKQIHKELSIKKIKSKTSIELEDLSLSYLNFCSTLCGYTAHVLGFESVTSEKYERYADNLSLTVIKDNGFIRITVGDNTRHELVLTTEKSPILAGDSFETFFFDGKKISWSNNIGIDEIERFCTLHKKINGKGLNRQQSIQQKEEKRLYSELKKAIFDKENQYPASAKSDVIVLTPVVTIEKDNGDKFKDFMFQVAEKIKRNTKADKIVVALPKCDEGEQKITSYARGLNEDVLFIPITLFDINSYRRFQNVILRQIIKIDKNKCPMCGGKLHIQNDLKICKNCGNNQTPLIIKKTRCPNPKCKHVYTYLEYNVKKEVLERMKHADSMGFYQADSLFQYKDIVRMVIDDNRIKTICPKCNT